MIASQSFLGAARERGFRFYTGVPCSYLKPFINFVIDSPELRYVGAANEGDAVAIAAGAELGGQRGVVMFQNSGLGNALNPLTSLAHTARIPMLLIPTLRGEVGGAPDEPQHELMGQITTQLLELMQIPWEPFPEREVEIDGALARAVAHMDAMGRPYALVMKKGTVEPNELGSRPEVRMPSEVRALGPVPDPVASRKEMLQAVCGALEEDDIAIATTGYTGRELYALGDRENHFYMVGSMGCASSLGLGLALTRRDRRVVVIDGDGAALMRLGALTTVGYEGPTNLMHILLDNRVHESTGGQATVSHSIDFASIAAASGYRRVERTASPAGLDDFLRKNEPGPAFVHVPIRAGTTRDLPRPHMGPDQVAARLRACLEDA